MEALQEFGINLIHLLQQLSPQLDAIMKLFTFMGTIEFYMLFITFLYWTVDSSIGFRVFMALLFADVITASTKILFHQPRPYWISDVKPLSSEHSYSLPSGHSSDSSAVWLTLAGSIKKRWMWISAIFVFLMISISRMYLGVHFPLDLLLGWAVGISVFAVVIKFGDQIGEWFNQKTDLAKIGLGFGVSLLFGLAGILSKTAVSSSPDLAEWASFSAESRNISGHFTVAGALFGTILGYVLMKKYAQFSNKGTGLQKGLRYMVGIAGVLIILYGLDPLFSMMAADQTALGFVLRYIRYGTASAWAMAGAPWVFLKLKLAAK